MFPVLVTEFPYRLHRAIRWFPMVRPKRRPFRLAVPILCLSWAFGAAQPALAQETRSAREAAFARMYAAPTDRAAMLDYARLSIALRDYEAAVAVLERLVALEPGNLEARKQIALAYFALGSDAMAQRQFDLIRAANPQMAAELAAYDRAAAERSDASQMKTTVWFGARHTTGPDRTAPEAGVTLNHRMSLGGPHGAVWATRLALSGTAAPESGTVDLRSGPILRAGGTASGPRLQPYVLLLAERDENGNPDRRLGLGLLALGQIGPVSLSADLAFGRIDDGSAQAGQFRQGQFGIGVPLSDTVFLRGRASLSRQGVPGAGDQTERTVGLDLGKEFGAGFAGLDVPLNGTLSVTREGLALADGTHRDRVLLAATLRARIDDARWLEIGAGADRTTSLATQSEWMTVRLGWEF